MNKAISWYQQASRPIDQDAVQRAEQRQKILTKPPGSLGELEHLAVRACGWMGDRPEIKRPAIVVFAADHGIAQEGVSAFPQAVTGEMVRNFATGGAAISVLSRSLGAMLEVTYLGTVNDPGPLPGVVRSVIGSQTENFLKAPAMTGDQLEESLRAGREAVKRCLENDADILVGGEMGIANTTSATALACAYLNLLPEDMAGPGTGLDADGVANKARIVREALTFHHDNLDQPVSVLRRLGGFEIAALAGAYIAAAQNGLPVLVDGFISTAAALAAVRIQPSCSAWMQLSHLSPEPGHARLLEVLSVETGSRPILNLGMRLGEGSGAALSLPLIKLALGLHRDMATFEEAGVSGSSDD